MKRLTVLPGILPGAALLALSLCGCATTGVPDTASGFLQRTDAVAVVRLVNEVGAEAHRDSPVLVQAVVLKVLKGPLEERTTVQVTRQPRAYGPAFVGDRLNILFLQWDADHNAWQCDTRRGRGTLSFAADKESLEDITLDLIKVCMEKLDEGRPRVVILGKDGVEVKETSVMRSPLGR